MKVRMKVSIAGHAMPSHGITQDFSFVPGDEVDLSDDLAKKWIEAAHAEKAPRSGSRKANEKADDEAAASV